MSIAVSTDKNGLCHARRDARWQTEVRRENLQGIVDAEKGAAIANVMCWLIVALMASTLANAHHYVVPLAIRMLATISSRMAFRHMRRRLAARARLGASFNWMLVSLCFAGFAWGLTLVPVVVEPFLDPGRMLVGGATIAGVSIIVALLMPDPRLAAAYILGFFLAYGLGLLWAPEEYAIKGALGVIGLFSIFLAYGAVAATRHRKAAEILVENRCLSEELSEALAHSEFLAYRDSLTGLPNRRAFFLQDELSDDQRQRHVLTVDLDYFKTINDTFGHAVGDRVLVAVARTMDSALRKFDSQGHCAARIGGEEFAIMLDVEESGMARMIAEKIRHEVALIPAQLGVKGLVTTASIGVSRWRAGERLDQVLIRADHALYRAKARGRDRVEHAEKAA